MRLTEVMLSFVQYDVGNLVPHACTFPLALSKAVCCLQSSHTMMLVVVGAYNSILFTVSVSQLYTCIITNS